jgi:hypothetical protein
MRQLKPIVVEQVIDALTELGENQIASAIELQERSRTKTQISTFVVASDDVTAVELVRAVTRFMAENTSLTATEEDKIRKVVISSDCRTLPKLSEAHPAAPEFV